MKCKLKLGDINLDKYYITDLPKGMKSKLNIGNINREDVNEIIK